MNEYPDMSCAGLEEVAAELALGVLTGRERAEAVAHLDRCDDCREHVRQLMVTTEGLLSLLPVREPPAGFETRVLDRLAMSAPGPSGTVPFGAAPFGAAPSSGMPSSAGSFGAGSFGAGPSSAGPSSAGPSGAGPSSTGPSSMGPSGAGPNSTVPNSAVPNGMGPRLAGPEPHGSAWGPRPSGRPSGPGRPASSGRHGRSPVPRGPAPGRPARPSFPKRTLAAAAVALAVVAAGLGGWGMGVSMSPHPSAETAQGPLSSAVFLTPQHQNVGQLFIYQDSPRWLYMSVDLPQGSGWVTCQVLGGDGRVSTVGAFRLTDGYGAWGAPDPGTLSSVRGAQLVGPDGKVLARATIG